MTTAARHGRKARKPLVVSVVLVDCLIYRGLRCSLRRHAAPSPDRDQSATTRMKKAHWNEYNEQLLRSRFTTKKVADKYRLFHGFGADPRSEQQEFEWLARDLTAQLRKLGSIRG